MSGTLESLLPLFTADDVPDVGPEEIPSPRFEPVVDDRALRAARPGGGLSRYPMLYIGEGSNTMFLLNQGKVIWTYSTGEGWEYDDIWMLSDGNIVFSRQSWVGMVTPDKRLIWRYDCSGHDEIHTVQPLGDGKVLMMINGDPARLTIVDMRRNAVLWERDIHCDLSYGVHSQFRRVRFTAQHTFLLPFLGEHKVVEYDTDMNEVWRYEIGGPWAAIRLRNGNTLITAEAERRTVEVDRDGNIVWQCTLDEIPEPYRLADSQSCVRLRNGNTILCSRGDGGRAPQLLEITPDKEVVWSVYDWNVLGPASAVQILSDPGIPEVPGDCER